ncbi:hypothetical protein B0T18DRAFT_428149 [Schizothecium vesticola]|uniref:SET domain-containing protein n=1 Tax=Schizothecium vesticola TaxID=314040 RepID=A0AA40F323_9PEZI|nr:hypothetical protein B0T18DRAFT_428149 [Schizothecium vesticola]
MSTELSNLAGVRATSVQQDFEQQTAFGQQAEREPSRERQPSPERHVQLGALLDPHTTSRGDFQSQLENWLSAVYSNATAYVPDSWDLCDRGAHVEESPYLYATPTGFLESPPTDDAQNLPTDGADDDEAASDHTLWEEVSLDGSETTTQNNMPCLVGTSPVEPRVDEHVFYAWNRRRTLQHRVNGVRKVQTYQVDTQRWSTEFSHHLAALPPFTPSPIEKEKRPTKRWAPYSPPRTRSRAKTEREQLAAAAAAAATDEAARDESIRAQVLGEARAHYSLRRGRCFECNKCYTDNQGSCGEACRVAFVAKCAAYEATHLELRQTSMGYGVFVRPGSGCVPADTRLAVYVGALIPFGAPELGDDGSRYLFQLYDKGKKKGSKKNQMYVDAETFGNWTRFVNSSCEPNCGTMTATLGKRAYILFLTDEDVAEGEELTICYGSEYFAHGETECLCNAFEGPHIPPA